MIIKVLLVIQFICLAICLARLSVFFLFDM